MKQFLRKSLALGLFTSMLCATPSALAIPDAQIINKLQGIPVFTLTDKTGSPLAERGASKGTTIRVYFSPKDAQADARKLQRSKPEVAKQLQIRPVPLSEVYKLQASKKINVVFVPVQSQVAAAGNVTNSLSSPKVEGVPLFLGLAGKQPGYLTINQNKKQVIPLFFDREQLTPYIEAFKKKNPGLATSTGIQVLTLEKFLGTLRSKDNPLYEKVVIMPSTEAQELLQNNKTSTRQ